MTYLTTTDLRTKTPELLRLLAAGQSIQIIHRSNPIGTIEPQKEPSRILSEKDIHELKKAVKKMHLPHFSDDERERRYRKHLIEKYG